MNNNHLLIGLGGTGGKIIKAFRKALFEEFRGQESPHPVKIQYLYVDSSTTDLAASENWRTQGDIGPYIGLPDANRLPIDKNDLQTRLRDPNRYRITREYIGDPALWTDIFSELNVQQAAGGQMRRLGAALFEPQCQEFVERVHRLCEDLYRERTKETCFHVCCGLAGGTGAGAFLHVIAQLRAAFDNANKSFPIFLYLLLPDLDSRWARNGPRTNYYANGYAALQELNGYLVGDPREGPNKGGPVFSPVDLTGKTERFENRSAGRTRLLDRLQGCFVISNVNERNLVIDVKNEEIHGLIAQMIFQRIFLIDSAEAGHGQELHHAITLENVMVEDEGLSNNPNVKVRSVRFLTFGLKRLIVPEEEIREHFSANFASQAALQMLYNNWPEDTHAAFLGEKKNETFKQFVQEKETRRLWKISDQQIALSEGILPSETGNPKWRSIDQDWEMIAPHLKKDAWSLPRDDRRDPRLDELDKALGVGLILRRQWTVRLGKSTTFSGISTVRM